MSYRQIRLMAMPIVAEYRDRAEIEVIDGSFEVALDLARKRLDNWPVWLAVNLVSVLLFSVKGLWLTAALYALFAVLSLAGWRAWADIARREAAHG